MNLRQLQLESHNDIFFDTFKTSLRQGITNGTVRATLYTLNGDPVAGATNITLVFVAGSRGNYIGTIPNTVALVEGARYTLKIVCSYVDSGVTKVYVGREFAIAGYFNT